MAQIFRVMVSENHEAYPDKTFIDFAPADRTTHEIMLKMRQKDFPKLKNMTDGLHLYDFGNGNIRFKTETPNDRTVVDYPKENLKKYQSAILKAYQKMREAGKEKTLDINNYDLAEVFDFYTNAAEDTPKSAREEELRQKSEYYIGLEDRRQDLLRRRHAKYEREETSLIEKYINNRGRSS